MQNFTSSKNGQGFFLFNIAKWSSTLMQVRFGQPVSVCLTLKEYCYAQGISDAVAFFMILSETAVKSGQVHEC
jgi:hypothetical protein